MDVHEKEMKYMCTIREYKAAHKWGSASNSPVTQAIELQEMGPEGRGSLAASSLAMRADLLTRRGAH